MAKISAFLVIICSLVCHFAQGAEPKEEKCHVMAAKRCVNLVGHWKADQGKGRRPDTLIVKATEDRSKFYFEVDVLRGQSITSFSGEFILKNDIGLYSGSAPYDKKDRCILVFTAINAKTLEVTSFGQCEEGHRAYPDGTYKKDVPQNRKPSNNPMQPTAGSGG